MHINYIYVFYTLPGSKKVKALGLSATSIYPQSQTFLVQSDSLFCQLLLLIPTCILCICVHTQTCVTLQS